MEVSDLFCIFIREPFSLERLTQWYRSAKNADRIPAEDVTFPDEIVQKRSVFIVTEDLSVLECETSNSFFLVIREIPS